MPVVSAGRTNFAASPSPSGEYGPGKSARPTDAPSMSER